MLQCATKAVCCLCVFMFLRVCQLSTSKDTTSVAILDRANIVCATLSGSGIELFRKAKCVFDMLIVDEAAQAVELSTLIPLRCTEL